MGVKLVNNHYLHHGIRLHLHPARVLGYPLLRRNDLENRKDWYLNDGYSNRLSNPLRRRHHPRYFRNQNRQSLWNWIRSLSWTTCPRTCPCSSWPSYARRVIFRRLGRNLSFPLLCDECWCLGLYPENMINDLYPCVAKFSEANKEWCNKIGS